MDEFIGDKAKKMKAQIEKLCVENKDKFIDYIESKKTLPDFFISEMQKIGACGFTCKGYGSPELTMLESGAMLYELGRADIGLALFMFLQNGLGIAVYDSCGDDEQKQRFLPDLISLKKIGCFALTEAENGSDATNMQTNAKKVEGGYILNGNKRWPGNGPIADLTVVWAKNVSDGNKI